LKHLCAQSTPDFILSKKIKGNYSYFNTDNLGNIYLLDNGNQLKKINASGDSVGVFNNVRKYGKLAYIDATNPLKLLLFYPSFATIVVLDRFLDVRNVINLREKNIFKVNAIGASYDNNIWVFDEGDGKLKKISDNGDLLSETNDLRLLLDVVPTATQLINRDGLVFLYDTLNGFFVFDNYGSLKNKIPFAGWERGIQINENLISGISQNKLVQYQIGSMNLKEFDLGLIGKGATNIQAAFGYINVLYENEFHQYKIKN
jgi:hypothetical protein